jgi:hypothetical protein
MYPLDWRLSTAYSWSGNWDSNLSFPVVKPYV